MTELERLVARSRQIGADPELVVHGGGNTSTKLLEHDWRGRERRVLRVKGSGTDLATIGADGFPGLYLDELDPLREREAMSDEEMVAYLAHCMVEPGGRPPSIETLLHAWLPAAHVDHTHADSICALTNHPGGAASVAEVLGADVAVVPYVRPGFDLSKQVSELHEADAVVLAHHGLVTWGESHEESFAGTRELADRAAAFLDRLAPRSEPAPAAELGPADVRALLSALRKELSGERPVVLHVDRGQRALADRADVAAVAGGRSTPDHILRIGARSAVVSSAADVAAAVAAFAADYSAYFERNRSRLPEPRKTLSPLPKVVLVPGLGCVTAGASARQAKLNADLATHSHAVTARVLDAFGEVAWLGEGEIFDFDYWPMELRKLDLAPPPPPLAGRVVLVALEGERGDAVARRLSAGGALVERVTGPLAGAAEAVAESAGGVDAIVAPASEASAASTAALCGDPAAAVVLDGELPSGGQLGPRASGVVVDGEDGEDALAEAVAFLALPAATGVVIRSGG